VSGSKDPAWTWANIVRLALPGLIVYPACWYAVIFRSRNYSLYQTIMLVAITFCAVSAVVAAFLIIGGFYVAFTTLLAAALSWKVALFAAVAPFAYALMVVIGAIILILPYMIIATPMALAHRWLLLKFFGPATPPFTQPGPAVPPLIRQPDV
jgi:hypothetical protein